MNGSWEKSSKLNIHIDLFYGTQYTLYVLIYFGGNCQPSGIIRRKII